MGTRSITHIIEADSGQPLVSIYRQFDGHPDSHGLELAHLANRIIVNGYHMDMTADTHANGPGCLAAQIVASLKDDIGNVYIVPPGTSGMGEEYTYTLSVPYIGGALITCADLRYKPIVKDCPVQNYESVLREIMGSE